MPKRKRKQAQVAEKPPSWSTTKKDDPKQGKIFDPSAASLRKNKEYLELKREIALKGTINISYFFTNQHDWIYVNRKRYRYHRVIF